MVKKVSFSTANDNLQPTSPKVQKDVCRDAAVEILNVIVKDIDNY